MKGIDYETLAAALDAAAGVLRGGALAAGRSENTMPASPPASGRRQTLLLTVEEAAEELRVGRSAVYDLIRSGRIESVQIGRSRRIRRDALVTFTDHLSS